MHFCIMIWLQADEGQGVECSELNRNVPRRLIYLNACSLGSGTDVGCPSIYVLLLLVDE